jgi:hypothetical protein
VRRNIASLCGDNDAQKITLYRQFADHEVLPGGRPTSGNHWTSKDNSFPLISRIIKFYLVAGLHPETTGNLKITVFH